MKLERINVDKEILISERRKRLNEIESQYNKISKDYSDKESKLINLQKQYDDLSNQFKSLQSSEIKSYKYDCVVEYEDGFVELARWTDIQGILSKDEIDSINSRLRFKEYLKASQLTESQIVQWIQKHQMDKSVYDSISKENQPLPKQLYIDHKIGSGWAQIHWRGIEEEKYQAVKAKKMQLWETLVGQSAHMDIRISYPGTEKLVQYVMTENDIQSMVRTMTGEKRETSGGVMNVQHSLIVSKPSGEPPEGPEKFYKDFGGREHGPSVNEEGAKLAVSLDLGNAYSETNSYWINPGEIGSTKNTYSYMMLIWEGKVLTGVERHDLHELFFVKEDAKLDLFNGKFTIKCLQDESETRRWEIWKSISDSKPLDPIMHSDMGYHWLVPEESVDGLGRDYYRDVSKKLYMKKFG